MSRFSVYKFFTVESIFFCLLDWLGFFHFEDSTIDSSVDAQDLYHTGIAIRYLNCWHLYGKMIILFVERLVGTILLWTLIILEQTKVFVVSQPSIGNRRLIVAVDPKTEGYCSIASLGPCFSLLAYIWRSAKKVDIAIRYTLPRYTSKHRLGRMSRRPVWIFSIWLCIAYTNLLRQSESHADGQQYHHFSSNWLAQEV